jgi:large subunit ribosomal protein L4
MVKVASYTKAGNKQEESASLEQTIFGVEPNLETLSLVHRAYEAAQRSAHPRTLTRGDVRGGGKKPWRQKGTGRARAGSSRLPHWRGGGTAFGPTGQENHLVNLPSRLKQQAVRQALSAQAKAGKLSVIEDFSADGRTKSAASLITKMNLSGRVLLVLPELNDMTERSTRNLSHLRTITAKYLNVHNVLTADNILLTKPALELLTQWLKQTESSSTTKAKAAKPTPKAKAKPEAPKPAAAKPVKKETKS